MKLIATLILSSAAALLLSRPSTAAVISRDWKSPGDGLLIYDTVNKREWLDLSQTILSDQFPGSDPSPQVTRENRYQYVVSQTNVGGLFEGFTVGNSADVIALAQSAGINTSLLGPANTAGATVLGGLLGFTYESSSASKIAIGLLDEPLNTQFGSPIRPGAQIDTTAVQAGMVIGAFHFQLPTPPGVMLYRNVPEPNGMALGVMGAILSTLVLRS
jgi:hypothetical protein